MEISAKLSNLRLSEEEKRERDLHQHGESNHQEYVLQRNQSLSSSRATLLSHLEQEIGIDSLDGKEKKRYQTNFLPSWTYHNQRNEGHTFEDEINGERDNGATQLQINSTPAPKQTLLSSSVLSTILEVCPLIQSLIPTLLEWLPSILLKAGSGVNSNGNNVKSSIDSNDVGGVLDIKAIVAGIDLAEAISGRGKLSKSMDALKFYSWGLYRVVKEKWNFEIYSTWKK